MGNSGHNDPHSPFLLLGSVHRLPQFLHQKVDLLCQVNRRRTKGSNLDGLLPVGGSYFIYLLPKASQFRPHTEVSHQKEQREDQKYADGTEEQDG